MSLTSARERLLTALTDAEIDTYYGWGAFSTPCARIFPSEPWVLMSGLAGGRRTQAWEVWAVSGRADSTATFDDLEALVMSINAAIDQLPDFGHVEWHRPVSVDMGGSRYLGCRGVIETLMEV
jgi:hypothetical protein